jgi:hypothetical protein
MPIIPNADCSKGQHRPSGPDESVSQEAFEERAAIMEYDGGLTREQAEAAARAAWPKGGKP